MWGEKVRRMSQLTEKGQDRNRKKGLKKVESNDSREIPERWETSEILGLIPGGMGRVQRHLPEKVDNEPQQEVL